MSAGSPPVERTRWFPVTRREEVIARHLTEAMLLGEDLVVWRDDAGAVNAWLNRCPHRGVRLSIGYNTGQELRCQYHGWRFVSGSGQCRFIPAHPTQKPAATMGATTFGVAEAGGYVWVRLAGTADPLPAVPGVVGLAPPQPLRSVFVEAPVATVSDALLRGYDLEGRGAVAVRRLDAYTLSAGGTGVADTRVVFMLQPVDAARSVVHEALQGAAVGWETLRHHNAQLTALQRSLRAPR
jgi:nitrite reductase/ring-hydroxylating ferredoxin subunit